MFLHFRSLSRRHIRISEGAVERSLCTNIREIRSLVSTSLPNDFHAFGIPFSIQDSEKMASNTTSSLLIQINSLRRNNNAFTSVIYNALHLISRCSNNRVLSRVKRSGISTLHATHLARKLFCITLCRRKTPHRRRTTPPSHIKRWCCFLRKWVGPFVTEWSATSKVASTFSTLKTLSYFVSPTQVHIQVTPLDLLLYWLFVGSALARLERSTLPEQKGTRTVVLRFLKIIEPVKCVMPLYDGFICCPEEGELHRGKNKVWNLNIGKWKAIPIKQGLQLLLDT